MLTKFQVCIVFSFGYSARDRVTHTHTHTHKSIRVKIRISPTASRLLKILKNSFVGNTYFALKIKTLQYSLNNGEKLFNFFQKQNN